ncbi:flavodoxin domain-containing protein [Cytobacillus sp. S13-E01]|uniref:flavodoxin domain-containing protein n=1 Tax=Cytobacillus sp. S13-E01 TaxID=3031326 RepID=UPI0023D85FDD|nr:flavodoxin domain-containing protein [Cytobacillus sp. S13-E01]MDF0726359.1 flavodoxin domain-containing protein [Cytobacillus sp. S13-E01]
MKAAIVYTSVTGNTNELVDVISEFFKNYTIHVQTYKIHECPLEQLEEFDVIAIGTYTWGEGQIPREMVSLYKAIESGNLENVITGVFGTGDSFYPKYCGAVDEFRDMLFVHTELVVTLKVELFPQKEDIERCKLFVDRLMKRLGNRVVTL